MEQEPTKISFTNLRSKNEQQPYKYFCFLFLTSFLVPLYSIILKMNIHEKLDQLCKTNPRRAEALQKLKECLAGDRLDICHNLEYIGSQVSDIYHEFKLQNDEEIQSAAWDVMLELNKHNQLHALHLLHAELDKDMTLAQYTEKLQARLVQATALGWTIHRNTISPPVHFPCVKNTWAAVYQCVLLDHTFVSVPHWFWHDSVLTTGEHSKY